MNKTLLVLKNDFIRTVFRRSFLLVLILIPLIPFAITWIFSMLSGQSRQVVTEVFNPKVEKTAEGYVDLSGLVLALPPSIPADSLRSYADATLARQALTKGEIGTLYLIPADYLKAGKITVVRPDFSPFSGLNQSLTIQTVMLYNLLGKNTSLAALVQKPLTVEEVNLSPGPQRDTNNMLTFFVPYGVMLIFYTVIMSSASLMLTSVNTEKKNRLLEILMVSVTPVQMLTGKIIALGLAGLLQTLVWTASGIALLRLAGQSFNLPAAFQLSPSILIWGVLFFLLGYTIYASLMAGVGALAPDLREASQATTVVVLPLIIPLLMLTAIINDPNGGIATGLSLFPLTAPVTIMTRLAAGTVPLWQILLSALLMALTAWLVLWATAGMFRAQTLLSGQRFSLKLFFRSLAGKA